MKQDLPSLDRCQVYDRYTFTRQVFLGETLDAEHIAADYNVGVLTLTIPVREAAKPRSIQVTSSDRQQALTA